jgi:hypothetical protein
MQRRRGKRRKRTGKGGEGASKHCVEEGKGGREQEK